MTPEKTEKRIVWLCYIAMFFALITCYSCKKYQGPPETFGSGYDTLKITARITYLNCSNTARLRVSTNKNKLLTNIQGAGFGKNNLAINDSARYMVSLTDTAHNLMKPSNLLHSGDSIYVSLYMDIGKTVPTGPYGYTVDFNIMSNNIYLLRDNITQFKPLLENSYSYIGYYIMP